MRFRSYQIDAWLLAALLASLCLGLFELDWGLPAGEHSWAVDGLEPVGVLGIVRKSLLPWNSGWFYFKYPLAYPLSLGAVFSPYLAYSFATGGWTSPASAYPYGFADPERSLYILALIGRGLSLAYTLGTVAVAYGIVRRLYDIDAARWAAWLVATCYPVVFYAHTMNVDASYLFWIFFSLYCAIVAAESDRISSWALLGVAAAMAVSTKEQAFGFLLPLPILALVARARSHGGVRSLPGKPVLAMAAAAIVTALVANNVLLNPLGFVARFAYLLGRPITPVDAPLKPVAFAWFKGGLEWTYLKQFWDGFDSALGTPLAWLAVAATLALIASRRRAAAWLLLPALGYYYLSLRGQQLITMRYSLPVLITFILVAAGFLAQLRQATRGTTRTAVTLAALLLAGLSLARAVELDLLLAGDSRYQAEAWMQANLPPAARGEVYQKPTYLPRAPGRRTLATIPAAQRSIAALEQRKPDFIVLSSESRKSITHVWNPDWRTTGDLLVLLPEADRLKRGLEAGELPYRRAAVFRQEPRLIRPRITGLAPEIAIWVRSEPVAGGGSDSMRQQACGAGSAPTGQMRQDCPTDERA